jgi:uncharacterized membrane protein
MHLDPALMPVFIRWATLFLASFVIILALRFAPWRLIMAVPLRQHLIYGGILTLCALWTMTVMIANAITIHILLIASVTLIFGPSLAILIGVAALALTTAFGDGEWSVFGVDALCTVIAPVLSSSMALILSRKIQVAHLFVFTLGAGFLGGALSVLAAALSFAIILGVAGQWEWVSAGLDNAAMLPLLMFPEGFLNGLVMTALVVYHPDWIRSFIEPE